MQATVYLCPAQDFIKYYSKNAVAEAQALALRYGYAEIFSIEVNATGEAAADECFDLSNNPMREVQRDFVWGQRRSLSVGDVVHSAGESFLCLPFGWQKL